MDLRNLFLVAALLIVAACGPSAPNTGTDLTFSHDDFLCEDPNSLEAMVRALNANDTTASAALFNSGTCWTDTHGTRARVLDHGTAHAQDGRTFTSVQVRVLDGEHAQTAGWTILRADGL